MGNDPDTTDHVQRYLFRCYPAWESTHLVFPLRTITLLTTVCGDKENNNRPNDTVRVHVYYINLSIILYINICLQSIKLQVHVECYHLFPTPRVISIHVDIKLCVCVCVLVNTCHNCSFLFVMIVIVLALSTAFLVLLVIVYMSAYE